MAEIKKTWKKALTNRKKAGILTKLFDGDEVQRVKRFRSEKDLKKVLDKRS